MAKGLKSSRIIVKNLPKQVSDQRMREHFAQKGEITDIRLQYTKDGKFRRFGFVGYRTAEEAEAAVKYFNDTYLDTSKLEVQIAKAVNDDEIERPWSKYSKGSSAHNEYEKKIHEKEDQRAKAEEEMKEAAEFRMKQREAVKAKKAKVAKMLADIYGNLEDPQLQEFLEVTKPRAKTATWSNEDTALVNANKLEEEKLLKAKQKVKVRIDEVDAKRPSIAGTKHSRTHIAFASDDEGGDDSDNDYQDIEMVEVDEAAVGAAVSPTESTGQNADDREQSAAMEEDESEKVALMAVSDLDYFRAKAGTLDSDDEEDAGENGQGSGSGDAEEGEEELGTDEEEEAEGSAGGSDEEGEMGSDGESEGAGEGEKGSEGEDTAGAEAEAAASKAALRVGEGGEIADEVSVSETGRLFVRNLPYTCTEEELTDVFKKYGLLAEVHMPLDKETKKPLGLAYILYMIPENAVRALEELDGSIFQGRLMHVLPARAKKVEKDNGNKTFKEKREAQKKANAEAEHTWNTLFMRSDTVAEALARKLKVSKAELLSRDADSVAVRMALGETHIIQETKQYLEEEGVRLEAFEGKRKRSKTVIIVKNIPFEISEDDLRAVFGKHGSLGRIILPPTRTIALVEFLEDAEAKMAFRSLAYTQFRNVPLYLEWAPEDAFVSAFDPEAKKTASPGESASETAAGAKSATMAPEEEEDGPADDALHTVFVKNLSFDTTDESLKAVFKKAGPIRSARIAKKKDMKNPGKFLSMGFGFVEYGTKEAATTALKTLQGVKMDGHVLELKLAKKGQQQQHREQTVIEKSDKAKSTKLLVKNVPFEATKKEINELFKTFGQVKSVRLPRKFDGAHRGFAFVEFVSKKEAKNAMDALRTTHFYGRHLVIEWAKEEPSVEALRAQTAKHYVEDGGAGSSTKKRKIELPGAA